MNPIYEKWLHSPTLSDDERATLRGYSEAQIREKFHAPLAFGTAGLRGIMGLGINAMNVHIVRHATQALAELVLADGASCHASLAAQSLQNFACSRPQQLVVIGYDCRENSQYFAREAACVMAANGIQVLLFPELCPTPQVSFAIRHFGAMAGINVTASHNPKEYNGYKVYWNDGAQLPSAHAAQVAAHMAELDIFTDIKTMPYQDAIAAGRITLLGEDIDCLFLEKVLTEQRRPATNNQKQIAIIYTPFHGAGYRLVPRVLREAGYTNVTVVPEQAIPDGAFPTVKSPNPENLDSFALAIETAKHENAALINCHASLAAHSPQNFTDYEAAEPPLRGSNFEVRSPSAALIIGTDPDADRVGVVVCNASGEYVGLSGNEIGVLLTDYLASQLSNSRHDVQHANDVSGNVPADTAVITTIVSTKMIDAVCRNYGVPLFRTYTGFKHIAEVMAQNKDKYSLLIGFEESFGYMIGDFCRDKDAVTASLLIVEMAHYYAEKGMSLLDKLNELYEKYGKYTDETINLVLPGVDGIAKMAQLMANLRDNPPTTIGNTAVIERKDYLDTENPSNVLEFGLDDGVVILIRPSGTEPKVKVYILSPHCDIEPYRRWCNTLLP